MARLSYVTRQMPGNPGPASRVKVWLRISHQSATRYLPTGITVGTHVHAGVRVPNLAKGFATEDERFYEKINADLAQSMREYHRRLALIENPALASVDDIAEALRSAAACRTDATLQAWAEAYAAQSAEKYARMVRLTMKYWAEFMPGQTRLDALTPSVMKDFQKYLRNRPKAAGGTMSEDSVGKSMAHIKATVNRAAADGAVSYDVHPFSGVKIRRPSARRCDVTPECVQLLASALLTDRTDIIARDVWMLSLYMGGMNFADMVAIDWRADEVVYMRRKTGSRTGERFMLPVTGRARKIVDRYVGDDGLLDFGFHYSDRTDEQRYLNRRIGRIGDAIGMPEFFSFVSARHTFAQFCLDLGIPDAVTNYLMGHSDSRGVITSYNRMSARVAGKVLERVEDYWHDPAKYEDVIVNAIFRGAM